MTERDHITFLLVSLPLMIIALLSGYFGWHGIAFVFSIAGGACWFWGSVGLVTDQLLRRS